MYSTMMTPISTDTPISARNPRPEETEKCVPVKSKLRMPPRGERATTARIKTYPFPRIKGRVKNE